MPTMNEMRQFCLDAYPNATAKWREHIATTKNTRQIVAIYKKLHNKPPKPVSDEYHQIDIWEYCLGKSAVGNSTEVNV